MWQECEVYLAPSSSGGKVWIAPKLGTVFWTLHGTYSRYKNGSTSLSQLSRSTSFSTLLREKIKKGYSFKEAIWVESGTFRISKTDPNASPTPTPPKNEP